MRIQVALIAVSLASCVPASPLPPEMPAADITAGALAYRDNGCRMCHGEVGRGDGPIAASLQPPPRDFADAAAFKNPHTVEAIADTIATGVPSTPTPMPPYAHLDERTRLQLAAWIVSLAASPSADHTLEPR